MASRKAHLRRQSKIPTKPTANKVHKRKSTRQTIATPMPAPTSRLLNLAAELRNQIYGYLVEEDTRAARVLSKSKGFVASSGHHPLLAVCRQTRVEFGAIQSNISAKRATHFIADVVDFDFGALKAFINRIPKATEMDHAQIFTIHLTITARWSSQPDFSSLMRWFNHLKLKVRTGTQILPNDIEYTFRRVDDKTPVELALKNMCDEPGEWLEPILVAFEEWFESNVDHDHDGVAVEAPNRLEAVEAVEASLEAYIDELDAQYEVYEEEQKFPVPATF